MPSPKARRPAAVALLAALGACLAIDGACSPHITEASPPPPVAFRAWVNPPPMSIRRCGWTARHQGEDLTVECTLVLERPVEIHGLWWAAYAPDGRELGHGGAALDRWNPGEEHRLAFTLDRPVADLIARIEVEPF